LTNKLNALLSHNYPLERYYFQDVFSEFRRNHATTRTDYLSGAFGGRLSGFNNDAYFNTASLITSRTCPLITTLAMYIPAATPEQFQVMLCPSPLGKL
jgi:hypothetical protein